jgi:hypothetical protein
MSSATIYNIIIVHISTSFKNFRPLTWENMDYAVGEYCPRLLQLLERLMLTPPGVPMTVHLRWKSRLSRKTRRSARSASPIPEGMEHEAVGANLLFNHEWVCPRAQACRDDEREALLGCHDR